MDTKEVITVAVVAEVTKKVIGPPAEYVVDELARLGKKQLENVWRIVSAAEKRMRERGNAFTGNVPPRVWKEIVAQGSYVDDPLMMEYFGGVLASSYTEEPRDDRGATMLALLNRLSNYQVRAHYIIYTMTRKTSRIHRQSGQDILLPGSFQMLPDQFKIAMDFDDAEKSKCDALVEHIMLGLAREDLISDSVYGPTQPLAHPCPMGIELYLWAHGFGNSPVSTFYDQSIDLGRRLIIPGLD